MSLRPYPDPKDLRRLTPQAYLYGRGELHFSRLNQRGCLPRIALYWFGGSKILLEKHSRCLDVVRQNDSKKAMAGIATISHLRSSFLTSSCVHWLEFLHMRTAIELA